MGFRVVFFHGFNVVLNIIVPKTSPQGKVFEGNKSATIWIDVARLKPDEDEFGMAADLLNPEECQTLLGLARQALELSVRGEPLPRLALEELPLKLRQPGATFVTLTISGNLRGCIGALEPYRPLAEDVRQHAVAAAFKDYRFPNVAENELNKIAIEISYLSHPMPVEYENDEDLLEKLRPGVDGVVLRAGSRRATFLPQVWEKIPDPGTFLDQLSLKMGAPPDFWRTGDYMVETYQVQEFHE